MQCVCFQKKRLPCVAAPDEDEDEERAAAAAAAAAWKTKSKRDTAFW
jgi:hypothetical protein